MTQIESFFCDNNHPTHAKVGIYGAAGTGKTRSAFEICRGLIAQHGLTKPVVFFDTEKGSDWVLSLFEKSGIKCLVKKSRTFADMMTATEIAEKHASIMIIDSISHVWRELCESFLDQHNEDRREFLKNKYSEEWVKKNFKPSLKLEFQHWGQIKPMWARFTEKYLNSNLHMIVCGRAGDIYEFQESESGKKELIKSGTKMATEKELSYEPSLLIELQRRTIDGQDRLFAVIEKDRSDAINGKEFELLKYENLKPHFDLIRIGRESRIVDMNANSSGQLFAGNTIEPQDEFSVEKSKKEVELEKIKALLIKHNIGSQSKEDKRIMIAVLEKTFNTPAWSEIEKMSSKKLSDGLKYASEMLLDFDLLTREDERLNHIKMFQK